MLPRELVRQIRRLQLRARRAVEDLLGGEYRSVFKGSGIAFEEVREYQVGDDVRAIDWNVTARMGHPFVKRYIEERELTLMLVVDVSASLDFSTGARLKREGLAEIAALLAFCAIASHDKVGLILVSDGVEKFLPPRKGLRHALRLIRDLLVFQPERKGSGLKAGLDYLNHVLHRRAIVFLFSDFLDAGYEKVFQRTARRHDLVAVATSDPREQTLPAAGLLTLEDAETGEQILIDSGDPAVRRAFDDAMAARLEALRKLARSSQVDLIEVATDREHLDALTRFFRMRQRRYGRW
ncbi:MAG: DUF58 domain-containing protein [Gemmataceae bacterium]